MSCSSGERAMSELRSKKRHDKGRIGASEVEDVIKVATDDHLSRERSRRQTARSDVRLYRNYMSVIVELCKQNNTPKRLRLFTKLYSLLVMSELLFPCMVGGVTWELIGMTEDVEGIGEYNWLAAIWSFLMEAIEDTKQKILVKKNLQIAGFAMILQMVPCLEVREVERGEPTMQAFCGSDEFQAYVDDT
ncbi:hypothetical protein Cgig2_015466 [Carnegiea gigantea]|uniref:Uncharacterized protein n=1 Tax=Carnegiea gigantea TaxID=171969 RepID=A0A9Q1JNM3_9CARY|nr:hypothetical protein Cgig2_015466 [Carnegiea gigantea]